MLSSPPPKKTSKPHLYVEKFSLKANCRLAERLFYNQDYKERPHIVRWEGRRSDQVGIHAARRGHK